MAEDWLADVRKYAADADEKIVAAIVRYCGIALQKRDSSLVAFSDSKETDRVRQNFLKKKLKLTQDDATLDAAIAAVGERMKGDRTKNRVTVYYLLTEHFGQFDIFAGKAKAAAKAPAAATRKPAGKAAPKAAAAAAVVAAAGAGVAGKAATKKPAAKAGSGTAATGSPVKAAAKPAAKASTAKTAAKPAETRAKAAAKPAAKAAAAPKKAKAASTAPLAAASLGAAGAAAAATAAIPTPAVPEPAATPQAPPPPEPVAAAAAVPPPPPPPSPEPAAAARPAAAYSAPEETQEGGGAGWLPWLLLGLLLLALIVFGLSYCGKKEATPAAGADMAATGTEAPAPAVAEPTPAAIPEGAGVIGAEREGKPMLTIYFDTGKSEVSNDLTAAASGVQSYLAAHPGATLAVSGFNDPTGNAALNAELSKNRAQAVAKALEGLGIPAASIKLEKPADTTDASGDNTQSRRVEVVVKE